MNHQAPLASFVTPPRPPARRGACPTLRRPMSTGDGLLMRFRPVDGAVELPALAAIAASAADHGNGRIEITARGSMQLRGVRPEAVEALAAAIEAVLPVEDGVAVETPPLAGLDPSEHANPLPLAATLRAAFAQAGLSARLSPKTSVIVDGGGASTLDAVDADLRLKAEAGGWLLSFGGRPVGVFNAAAAVPAALAELERLAAAGAAVRARDLTGAPPPATARRTVVVGRHLLADGTVAIGIGLAFGTTSAAALASLAEAARAAGATFGRTVHGRALLLVGVPAAEADAVAATAASLGFVIDPADPRLAIAACPGTEGCAAGHIAARRLAARLADEAAGLLDGSFTLHVSGCAKGCAHPATSPLTIVGTDQGPAIAAFARAHGPSRPMPEATLAKGLATLAARYPRERGDGETAAAWLRRTGPDGIAQAFG
jgi:precorrin-3B synthase